MTDDQWFKFQRNSSQITPKNLSKPLSSKRSTVKYGKPQKSVTSLELSLRKPQGKKFEISKEIKQDMKITYQNYLFMFGCRPSKTVNADTDMVYEIIDTFETIFDKSQLTIKLPDMFAQIVNNEAKIELVKSNSV